MKLKVRLYIFLSIINYYLLLINNNNDTSISITYVLINIILINISNTLLQIIIKI